jgi:hypothetical protein
MMLVQNRSDNSIDFFITGGRNWVKSECCGKESRGRAILARLKEMI